MSQHHAGQSRSDDGIDNIAGGYLYYAWNALDKFRFGHLRAYGKKETGFLDEPFVVDPADIQGVAGLFERDRDASAGYDGLEQLFQLSVKVTEGEMQVVMVVFDDILRLHLKGEGHQLPDEAHGFLVKPLRVEHRRAEKVRHQRDGVVDRMEQPEDGYLRGCKVGQGCVTLPPLLGEACPFRDQDLDLLAKHCRQPIVRGNLKDRRDIIVGDL